MEALYPCLGIKWLGMCAYNPAEPYNIYFDIGGAITALGFTLALQQLIRPIYQFRLRASGISFWQLTVGIFIGCFAVFIASLLPQIPINHDKFFEYPIFWEFLGGLVISVIYGLCAYLILSPTRIHRFNLIVFVRAAGTLLSEAKSEDRIKFASDLSHNIESLFEYASAYDLVESESARIEFARLAQIGAPLSISGPIPISPFSKFTHRKALEKAWYANSLLKLFSDEKFCATLVHECPWHTALIIEKIANKRLHVRAAENFIQQLAKQAIVNDESMMAREIGYDGFAQAPVLSESLFSNPFILRQYRPLNKLMFERRHAKSAGYVSRLNSASELMLEAALKHHGYWSTEYISDVEQAYKGVSRELGWSKPEERENLPDSEWHWGIRTLYNLIIADFSTRDPATYEAAFKTDKDTYDHDLIECIANIVYESLECIANNFEGFSGRFWVHSIGVIMDVFPRHKKTSAGVNPLQQRLALKLIEKLNDNMRGWYPAISRVLLATVGPYETPQAPERTAFELLQDAMYLELKNFPALYAKDSSKIQDYLPANVVYDSTTNSLTHTYSGGSKKITHLDTLTIQPVDLFDPSCWTNPYIKTGL